MSKKEQLLTIDPQNELKFRGPFNQSIISYMRLTNPTNKIILFKIKTTAPKKYCVRPNCGTLNPNDTIEIAICLQPFIFDPSEKNKHKFMVQSLVAPEGEIQFDQLWKDVKPDQLMESKLRCLFELPPSESVVSKTVSSTVGELPQATEKGLSSSDENTGDVSSDVTRLVTDEVRELRESESKLRYENLLLQEQVLRLRSTTAATSSTASTAFQNPYSPPQELLPQRNLIIAAMIGVALLGIILGKFLL